MPKTKNIGFEHHQGYLWGIKIQSGVPNWGWISVVHRGKKVKKPCLKMMVALRVCWRTVSATEDLEGKNVWTAWDMKRTRLWLSPPALYTPSTRPFANHLSHFGSVGTGKKRQRATFWKSSQANTSQHTQTHKFDFWYSRFCLSSLSLSLLLYLCFC